MKTTCRKIICFCALICCLFALSDKTTVEADEVSAAPILQISNYTIDEGALTPGSVVTINFSVTNTSNAMAATDAVLTLKSESGVVYPVYGEDNQLVLGTVQPGETVTNSIKMNVSKYFKDEVVPLECDFSYLSGEKVGQNQVIIAIPSTTGYSLNISEIKIAENATMGAKSLVNFELTNISGHEIKDAKLQVTGNVDDKSKVIDLGVISANKKELKDCYIIYKATGEQTIALNLVYTDENGEEVTIDQGKFTINVESSYSKENDSIGINKLCIVGYVFAGIAFIVAFIIVVKYVKKHV